MSRCMLFVVIAVVLGAPGRNARADEFKPEEIIDKAIRAHGGEDRLKELSAFSLKDRRIYEKGPTWNYEVTADLPLRYRSEMKVGPEGKTRSLIVIDGDNGWLKVTGDDATPYPSSFLTSMRKNIIPYAGPRSILRLRARQRNPQCHISMAGESTIDGHQAVGLRMKLEGGPQETWFFDKESGLLLKSESRTANFEGEETVNVTTYENYQTFDGFPIARKETSQQDGKPAWTREVIDFKVVTPSQGAFDKP
jgi:hypothetical protein